MENAFLSINYTALISHLWDENVEDRAADLESGSDYTYNKVIRPWVLSQMEDVSPFSDSVLDIGSGCGFLTNIIYNSGWTKVVGIDISERSVEYSQKKYPHIKFINQDIYKLSEELNYDLCLAVMAVNNMPNADYFFEKVSRCLNKQGKIILVLPHPCFWPSKHIDDPTFCYDKEAGYYKKFSTKGKSDYEANVLFYHRPIEQYFYLLNMHGFEITKFEEIVEREDDQFPDILGIIATKKSETETTIKRMCKSI